MDLVPDLPQQFVQAVSVPVLSGEPPLDLAGTGAQPAERHAGVWQQPGSPFSPAGPVRYLTDAEWNLAHPGRHVLHDVTLAPGQGIMIGMPLRIRYCADRRNYAGQDVFMVTVRFLGFTHTVPIPWVDYGRPVVTNAPGGQPGHPGAFCPT